MKAAFDMMIEGLTREVDALVRDLNMVIGSSRGERESVKYGEFAAGLRQRIDRTAEVVKEGREIIGGLRVAFEERDWVV